MLHPKLLSSFSCQFLKAEFNVSTIPLEASELEPLNEESKRSNIDDGFVKEK